MRSRWLNGRDQVAPSKRTGAKRPIGSIRPMPDFAFQRARHLGAKAS